MKTKTKTKAKSKAKSKKSPARRASAKAAAKRTSARKSAKKTAARKSGRTAKARVTKAKRTTTARTEIMKTTNRKFEGKEVINFEQKKIDNKWFNVWFLKNTDKNQQRQEVAVSRYTMAEGETLKFFKLRSLNNLNFTIGMKFKHVL